MQSIPNRDPNATRTIQDDGKKQVKTPIYETAHMLAPGGTLLCYKGTYQDFAVAKPCVDISFGLHNPNSKRAGTRETAKFKQ
jgi:hypothetical protein